MSDARPPAGSGLFDMPWRITLELRRRVLAPLARAALALRGVEVGRAAKFFGVPRIQRHRGSRIALGDRTVLRSWPASNPLAPLSRVVLSTRAAGAEIVVGPRTGLTGTVVVAETRVAIGADVFVGANVTIADTDFHPIHPARRREAPSDGTSRPVEIGDEVFIGMHSLILKGVTIGRGAVVGAGSVVSRDVPAYAIVAGNPAVVIRQMDPDPST